jgi:pimeloyl-ACP methyl ester carboxylesterase
VHGLDDQIVPVGLSRPYTAQDGVSAVELPGVGHYALIDPKAPAWEAVVSALATIRPPLP